MLVISQLGESQNGGNKKTKHAKFSEKRTFLPRYAHVRFFGKFRVLFSCYLRFKIRLFALLPMNLEHTLENIAVKSLPPRTLFEILLRTTLKALRYLHNIF